MTTLKELKELDAKATSAPWLVDGYQVCNRESPLSIHVIFESSIHLHSVDRVTNSQLIAATRNSLHDLIRVIELADEALKSCYFRNHDEIDYDGDLVDNALSEIRKLKGE